MALLLDGRKVAIEVKTILKKKIEIYHFVLLSIFIFIFDLIYELKCYLLSDICIDFSCSFLRYELQLWIVFNTFLWLVGLLIMNSTHINYILFFRWPEAVLAWMGGWSFSKTQSVLLSLFQAMPMCIVKESQVSII